MKPISYKHLVPWIGKQLIKQTAETILHDTGYAPVVNYVKRYRDGMGQRIKITEKNAEETKDLPQCVQDLMNMFQGEIKKGRPNKEP